MQEGGGDGGHEQAAEDGAHDSLAVRAAGLSHQRRGDAEEDRGQDSDKDHGQGHVRTSWGGRGPD